MSHLTKPAKPLTMIDDQYGYYSFTVQGETTVRLFRKEEGLEINNGCRFVAQFRKGKKYFVKFVTNERYTSLESYIAKLTNEVTPNV